MRGRFCPRAKPMSRSRHAQAWRLSEEQENLRRNGVAYQAPAWRVEKGNQRLFSLHFLSHSNKPHLDPPDTRVAWAQITGRAVFIKENLLT